MNNFVKLALAGLLPIVAALAAMPSFADCNPPCRNGKVCRYDSTHNPQFFCRKPATAQAAAAPSQSPAAPAKPAPLVSEIGFPNAKSTASPQRAGRNDADSATQKRSKWQPSEFDASASKRPARP